MNIIKLILKPALQRKFDLKQIETVLFKANTIKDALDLTATGTNKLNAWIETPCLTLKLSENLSYFDMFESNIKATGLKYKKLNVIYMKLDFIKNEMITEVFYINQNDTKLKQDLKQKI